MYKAKITISLRPSILDPQGKAAHHALENLGMKQITGVRIGKFIEMNIDAKNREEAVVAAEEASRKLLANPVMEDYTIDVIESN